MYDDCIQLLDSEDSDWITVCVQNEMEGLFELSERIHARFDEAYMNGYNWDALIRYYVDQVEPGFMVDVETDPEAGSFSAYMPRSAENMAKMKRFETHVRTMVADEAALLEFIEAHRDEIEWD